MKKSSMQKLKSNKFPYFPIFHRAWMQQPRSLKLITSTLNYVEQYIEYYKNKTKRNSISRCLRPPVGLSHI